MAANSLVFIGTGGAVLGFPGEGMQASQLAHTKETRATDKPADKLMDEPVPPPIHDVQRTNRDDGDNMDHRLSASKSVHQTPQNGTAPVAGSPRPGAQVAAEEPVSFDAETHTDRIRETIMKTGDDVAKLASDAASASQKNLDQSLPLNEVRADSTASAVAAAAAAMSIEQESTASNIVGAPQVEPVALMTSADPKSTSVPEPVPAATICETTSPKKVKPSTATKASRAMKAHNVVAGKKRKLSNVDKLATAKALGENQDSLKNAPPPDKKRKLNQPPAKSPAEDSVTAPAKPTPSVFKVLKGGKKERKLPVVGRTNRKTRSQGPVDL
ncbi:hypothetical protein E4U39_000476 [Claviceps sp. Clav50 group G5]|nr:hypothetical protein E4U39_000476 [Claviceps sp. Clav50 group G5]